MSDGIIGLIIMIIAINVGGRILRALTSGKAKQGPGKAGAKGVPPTTPQKDILESIMGQRSLAKELFGESPPVGPEETAVDVEPHEVLAHEGGDEAGDSARWEEDRFEELSDVASHEEEFVPPHSKISVSKKLYADDKTAPRREKFVEGAVVQPPGQMEIGVPVRGPIREVIGDIPSLRKAVIMSMILGPCRAKRRHR